MFLCIFTILFTSFILLMNISHLHLLLPFDLGKLVRPLTTLDDIIIRSTFLFFQQTIVYLFLTIAFIVLSIFLLQEHSDSWIDEESFWSNYHLMIVAVS